MVNIYYDSDETVKNDVEIQEFVKDVSCFGMNDCDSHSEYRFNFCRMSVSLSVQACMIVCVLRYSKLFYVSSHL